MEGYEVNKLVEARIEHMKDPGKLIWEETRIEYEIPGELAIKRVILSKHYKLSSGNEITDVSQSSFS